MIKTFIIILYCDSLEKKSLKSNIIYFLDGTIEENVIICRITFSSICLEP